jgi:hypothetical protein
MITNPDGTPYQVTGSLQVFSPNQEEKELLNEFDAEIIKINGTPILYYEYLADANTIDPLYWEARGAIFSQVPVVLYAAYDPITSQNYQNMFGIDAPDNITFELNYQATVEAIGHMPQVGSRLFTPHRGENWEIIQRSAGDWKLWGQIRMILECVRFQESKTRGEGKITQTPNPYKVN